MNPKKRKETFRMPKRRENKIEKCQSIKGLEVYFASPIAQKFACISDAFWAKRSSSRVRHSWQITDATRMIFLKLNQFLAHSQRQYD